MTTTMTTMLCRGRSNHVDPLGRACELLDDPVFIVMWLISTNLVIGIYRVSVEVGTYVGLIIAAAWHRVIYGGDSVRN